MSALEKRFRRNFVLACVVHAVLIGGIILFEGVINSARSNAPTPVELITPADILGDLPKGEGQGRGNYAPPPPETSERARHGIGRSGRAASRSGRTRRTESESAATRGQKPG